MIVILRFKKSKNGLEKRWAWWSSSVGRLYTMCQYDGGQPCLWHTVQHSRQKVFNLDLKVEFVTKPILFCWAFASGELGRGSFSPSFKRRHFRQLPQIPILAQRLLFTTSSNLSEGHARQVGDCEQLNGFLKWSLGFLKIFLWVVFRLLLA